MPDQARFGLTGLAVMGANLARNVARRGIPIVVHNRTDDKTRTLIEKHGSEGDFTPTYGGAEAFVAAIARPRAIMIMVKAGAPVDQVIDDLVPFLDSGDVIVDGGNSFFKDTQRRARDLEAKGLHFIGTGVSGGEEGALHGPSIMPGGSREAYAILAPVLEKIAAQVDGTPCCAYIGPDGAGHYVKMVHNGIEYADMQLIAEAYDFLRRALGLGAPELAEIFTTWSTGDLDSYLIDITADVLRTTDPQTGRPLVDLILDKAAQKGTGQWTAESALELGSPVTAITEAVFARVLSSMKTERTEAARLLRGPNPRADDAEKAQLVDDVRDALYASKITAYAQGFAQMEAASKRYDWQLDLGAAATIWRGGCIIRARFLDRIREAYAEDASLANLLLAPYFREGVDAHQGAWRRVVARAVQLGIPVPAFSSALAYYDGYRQADGPANLIQGLRDLFGAHTYERTDRPGVFHTEWAADESVVG